ncbi:hypothetical protein O6H91_03G006700 [Diphasiastrum complanatum]|uniref:Uncharacterized protein n=1 Tax=Diphasiastrum complanatum TaxID=34168 RepID=A0ACC2E3B0_DIPCM|nr:hypothetical protein O6H91_03G006700 [Diphasiastrum complanatum]
MADTQFLANQSSNIGILASRWMHPQLPNEAFCWSCSDAFSISYLAQFIAAVCNILFILIYLLTILTKNVKLFTVSSDGFLDKKASETCPHSSRVGKLYKTTFICVLYLLLIDIFVTIWVASFTWRTMDLRQSLLFELDVGLEAVSWIIVLLGIESARKRAAKTFPTILRAWWVFRFCLSMVSLIPLILRISHKAPLSLDCWVGIVSSPAIAWLCYVAIQRETGIESAAADLQEPLLVPKCEKLERITPYSNAGIWSLATLSWVSPLIAAGSIKPVELDDIPLLADCDRAASVYQTFQNNLDKLQRENPSRKPSLTFTLFKSFWKDAVKTSIFAIMNTIVSYTGPLLISYFVDYLAGVVLFPSEGYILAFVFLGGKFLENFSQRQWFLDIQILGLHVRSALTAMVYRKGFRLSNQSRHGHTSGEIINYMAVDCQRVSDFSWYMNDIWLLPLQVALALGILYINVGIASLASVAATILIVAGNTPLSKMLEKFQDKIMEAKDKRMKSTSECLRSMRILKLQAWETVYLKKMENLRKVEYSWLAKTFYTQAAVTCIFWGAPIFISVITFGTCILLGIPLTVGRVLSALATFRVLQEPLNNFPDFVSMVAQTKVSLDRLLEFLEEEELQSDAVTRLSLQDHENSASDLALEITNGIFSWDPALEKPTLSGIDIYITKGMKVAICGVVGSGKSSLLSSILGEIPRLSGMVKVKGKTAYVSQSAWIQTGKIEENILFGNPMNKVKYEKVLEACALTKDLEVLSHGDQTEIGERGINLSGGQKQRIQLARAVYQDADIYLLDDPFSAVDVHTGTQMFKECILGVLASKTLVFVTHQVEFLPTADLILVMQDGQVTQAGKYDDLLEKGTDFSILVGAHNKALEAVKVHEVSENEPQNGGSLNIDDAEKLDIEIQHGAMNTRPLEKVPSKKNDKEAASQLVQEEERERGNVSLAVYGAYVKAVYNGALIPVALLAQTLFQSLQISSNWWMAQGTPATPDEKPPVRTTTLMLVYIALALGTTSMVLIRAVLVAFIGLAAAQKFYLSMLHCIFRAPMSFFDSTPTGRILNRASTDQSALDLELPYRLAGMAFQVIQILGIIAVMSISTWQVLLIFVPVAMTCIWIQRYYIKTARELSRLLGIHKAPIIHHFSESIAGVATIRGFDQEERFMQTNLKLIDSYARPAFYSAAAMEWLCLRLELLTNFVFTCSMVILISLPRGAIDPSLAGLAVTYGLNLNIIQSWLMWNLCSLENKIISVERIQQYTTIASEAPLVIENCRPPSDWPQQGSIDFQNLQIRYTDHSPLVLHGITCSLPGGKKIGVVGRTGSGKSTLIQALFRIVEPAAGKILIDDINISTIGLHDLRSRLSIIPQDPIMFEGTLRQNLDPLEEHTDADLWEALEGCQLANVVQSKENKLDSWVTENGDNWSVGQRQLVCLGRVMLRRTRILVLDEATASVDTATDSLIQSTLRSEFDMCTVVTIAHRIPTVVDSDAVLVLSDGRVAEYDAPAKLLENTSSLFYKLVSEYSKRSMDVTSPTDSQVE